jgi:hypothetical protein
MKLAFTLPAQDERSRQAGRQAGSLHCVTKHKSATLLNEEGDHWAWIKVNAISECRLVYIIATQGILNTFHFFNAAVLDS